MNEKIERENEDQAEELRQLIGDVQANESHSDSYNESESVHTHLQADPADDIDILNLPPRQSVHQKKKTPIKLKIKRPLLRLLIVAVILILIGVLAWKYMDGTMMSAVHPLGENRADIWFHVGKRL